MESEKGRTSNDGKNVSYGQDGKVDSVDRRPVSRGMSGTKCWDEDGNPRNDGGKSSKTRGDYE